MSVSPELPNINHLNGVDPSSTQFSAAAQPEPPASNGQEVFERLMRDGEVGAQGFVPYTRTDPETGRQIQGWESREARAAAPTEVLDMTRLRQTIAAAPTAYLPRIPAQRPGSGTLAPLPGGHMRTRAQGEYHESVPSSSSSMLGRAGVFSILGQSFGRQRTQK